MRNEAPVIVQCAWCRRVQFPDTTWTKQPVVIKVPGLQITHGICQPCADKEREAWQSWDLGAPQNIVKPSRP
jgi:hypothetical protein